MSNQPRPKPSVDPADDDRSESVVGVYDRPEQSGQSPLIIIISVVVVLALIAGLVIWLI
jgi:cytochrome b subunit of formate dehydrogenase